MMEGLYFVSLFAGALNRAEFTFSEVLVPWIVIVGALGFLTAWLVVAILERTGLSRYVWHLPLFFVGLVVLFSSLIGMVVSP
jgi:predicted naringenin-chalcone synthase